MIKKKQKNLLSLSRALFIIVLSTCIISGSALFSFFYYKYIKEKQRSDVSFEIIAVVQTSPDNEAVKTSYFTELLDLSVDRPKNIYDFNVIEALEKLKQVPFIKSVELEKIRPATLHIDYVLRKPIAYFADYTNTAIDEEGILFPFKPFFTPKRLPEIYMGIDVMPPIFGEKVSHEKLDLAFALLSLTTKIFDENASLIRVDVSSAFSLIDGKRQIILKLEERVIKGIDEGSKRVVYPRILRLCVENYEQQLANYQVLRKYLNEEAYKNTVYIKKNNIEKAPCVIIDLRLSDRAFVSKIEAEK